MKNPTYYNGTITPYDSAVIPLSDRSIFFADSVYEVMIGRGEKVYQFDEHFTRLCNNCTALGLDMDITPTMLSEIICELLSLSSAKEFSVYVQLSGNSEKRSHLRSDQKANILVYINEMSVPNKPNKIRAITLPDMRYEYCNLKTTNLLPAVLSMNKASQKNADIAIFHKNLWITECTHANIAVLKDGVLKTPPLSNRILPGITRRTLLEVCKEGSVPYREEELSVSDLFSSDAVIVSSTTKLLQICTEIDKIPLPPIADNTVYRLFGDIYADFLSKTR